MAPHPLPRLTGLLLPRRAITRRNPLRRVRWMLKLCWCGSFTQNRSVARNAARETFPFTQASEGGWLSHSSSPSLHVAAHSRVVACANQRRCAKEDGRSGRHVRGVSPASLICAIFLVTFFHCCPTKTRHSRMYRFRRALTALSYKNSEFNFTRC